MYKSRTIFWTDFKVKKGRLTRVNTVMVVSAWGRVENDKLPGLLDSFGGCTLNLTLIWLVITLRNTVQNLFLGFLPGGHPS